MATKNLVGLIRVSTRMQGETKNGLESQRAEITRWAEYNGYNLITIMEEVASGSLPLSARPIMSAALSLAKKMDARVCTTRVDRCSRDAETANRLMKRGLVLIIELGEQADKFVSYLNAGLAERDNTIGSERTKRGMQAAIARGVVMGNRTNLAEAQRLGREVNVCAADDFALAMRPIIKGMLAAKMTYKEIAESLNTAGTPTARRATHPESRWHASTVGNIINRYRFLPVN